MKIDAEVHFWKYDKTGSRTFTANNKLLQQHYLPEQLSQSLHRNGIGGCIAVTAGEEEVETRFLAELSLTHPEIKGVVAQTGLHLPKSGEKIQELQAYPAIRGFRMKSVKDLLPTPAVMDLLREYQLSLDIGLEKGTDISAITRFMQDHPDQPFILQNSGNPETRATPQPDWETTVRSMAGIQNISCKVAGLLTGGVDPRSWKPADLYPYLDILFDVFGADRLLFASDWPFVLISGMYVQWKSLLEKFMEKFSTEDQARFFGENAARLYRI